MALQSPTPNIQQLQTAWNAQPVQRLGRRSLEWLNIRCRIHSLTIWSKIRTNRASVTCSSDKIFQNIGPKIFKRSNVTQQTLL